MKGRVKMLRSPVLKWMLCMAVALVLASLASETEAAKKLGKLDPPAPRAEASKPNPLPKSGSLAVVIKGLSEQHDATTAAIVAQQLTSKGYKVVDEKKLAAIRNSKAAMLALEGNVEGIMALSKQYGVSTTVTINVRAEQARLNSFNFYTATASAAVSAYSSGGTHIYGDSVQSKELGNTPDEARQNAVVAAARDAAERMTQ